MLKVIYIHLSGKRKEIQKDEIREKKKQFIFDALFYKSGGFTKISLMDCSKLFFIPSGYVVCSLYPRVNPIEHILL